MASHLENIKLCMATPVSEGTHKLTQRTHACQRTCVYSWAAAAAELYSGSVLGVLYNVPVVPANLPLCHLSRLCQAQKSWLLCRCCQQQSYPTAQDAHGAHGLCAAHTACAKNNSKNFSCVRLASSNTLRCCVSMQLLEMYEGSSLQRLVAVLSLCTCTTAATDTAGPLLFNTAVALVVNNAWYTLHSRLLTSITIDSCQKTGRGLCKQGTRGSDHCCSSKHTAAPLQSSAAAECLEPRFEASYQC
jgi:hypothetical protein